MPIGSPVVWTDGDDPANTPNADDLNEEWKEALSFLMGYDRPIAFVYSTTGTSITTTETLVPFNNQKLVRGGMSHSTSVNNTQITLPYYGQYIGWYWGGFATISTLSTRLIIQAKLNGTNFAYASMKPEFTGWNIAGSLTVNANPGDIVTMTMRTASGTAVMNNTLLGAPRICLYYAGDYS